MCSGWNTESDNNTQFQLNSLMCDLYLRDCFLLQSEVLKTLQDFVCIYASVAWVSHENMFCIIWCFETLVCSCVLTRYEIIEHQQIWLVHFYLCKQLGMFCLLPVCLWLLCKICWLFFALLLLCCGEQTWRTSRPREEVQWGFVKVKEWSYYVAHHPTLEVRWPILKSLSF